MSLSLSLFLIGALGGVASAQALPSAWSVPSPGPISSAPWWTSFEDPTLSALMEEGLAQNGDLVAFNARVEQSDALARQSLAGVLPSLSVDVSTSTAPLDSLGFTFGLDLTAQPDAPEVYHSGSGYLKASVPVDLWGKSTQTWIASRHDAAGMAGDRDAQLIALATRIGQAWIDLELARERLSLVEEQVAANEELLNIVQRRYDEGLITSLDLLQQQRQVASVRAQLPAAHANVRIATLQLNTLLGRPSATTVPEGGEGLPSLPPTPGLGSPEELLTTRPDLRAANSDELAAAARRKAAMRAMAPALTLTGQVGYQGIYISELNLQDLWGVGVALSVPIFSGGRNLGGAQAAQATERAAEASLGQLVLTATQEVEEALAREESALLTLDAVRSQERAAKASYDESRAQYERGLVDHLTVLSSLSTYQQAQVSSLSAERDLLVARIQLHDALGGTWTESVLAAQAGGQP